MGEEKRKLSLTAVERETIISFGDSGQRCQIYTCSHPMITKLDKLCKSNSKNYGLEKQDAESKTYITGKRLISFRSEIQRRAMTEEQKQAAADRMKKMRGGGKLQDVRGGLKPEPTI